MKTILRIAVAGALMAGYATAQAQTLPSSGSSDLWLFVSDQSAKTTFAEDTGVSLSSIMTGPFTTGASGSTAISANFTVAATSALTSYINAATAAGQTLEWGVLGAQFNGANGANDSSNQTPGTAISVFDQFGSTASTKVKGITFGSNATIGTGLDGDLSTLLGSYTAGGKSYALGDPDFNVWGEGTGDVAGSTNLYGAGLDQSGLGLGSTASLYGLTGNGNGGKEQSYLLGTNLELSAAGVLTVGNGGGSSGGNPPPPVPLPAAVWLFGSGLLGLIGVGRRKAASA